jgi:hypothetical protein
VNVLNPNCPDWKILAAHRRERHGAEPVGWNEALKHLDRCERCRQAAVAADPSLLFRRLSKVPPAPAAEAAEAESIIQAVAGMRAATRMGAGTPPRRRAGWRAWRRHAAAAALIVAALPLGGDDGWRLRLAGQIGSEAMPLPEEALQPAAGLAAGMELDQPLIENLDRPEARIYQMGSPDVAVVMIFDENFEV